MWGEKREREGNQTPKFPFSIKRKISKNLGSSSKVYNFFDFCVRMIRAPFVGLIKWKFIHLIRVYICITSYITIITIYDVTWNRYVSFDKQGHELLNILFLLLHSQSLPLP